MTLTLKPWEEKLSGHCSRIMSLCTSFLKHKPGLQRQGFMFLIWNELVGKMPNYFSGVRNVLYLYPAYSWGDAPGRSEVLIYNCDNSLQFCSWKMSGTFCFYSRKRTETNFKTLEVAMKQKRLPLGSINKAFKYTQCWIPLPLLVGYSVMYGR